MADHELRPFRVAVSQAALDDLRQRLDRVRWADELPGAGWDYGVPAEHVRELVGHWRTRYDWRAVEARLNAYPQFTTVIDGQRIHFLHVPSPAPDAFPLIMTHGWPGSVAEFLDVIGPLTDPESHGAAGAQAFHLVIPSLPGHGFSGPTTERGWHPVRIARAWAELMSRLGFNRYGAAGNDWNSVIAPELGRVAPESVVGVHVTQIFADPAGTPGELDDLSPTEQAAMADREWFAANMDAYQKVQRQQPQTLAHALADSPVGLLAWHCQIYRGQLDPDFILTNVMTYWLTGTVGSSMRLYREELLGPRPVGPTTVPLGLAQFTHDTQPVRRFVERDHANVVRWNVYDRPGHFAAHQSPELLVADIRDFFTALLAHA